MVVLVRGSVTDPVMKECQTALHAKRAMLVFVATEPQPGSRARGFLTALNRKYQTYRSPEDLQKKVSEAVRQHAIDCAKGFPTATSSEGTCITTLEALKNGRSEVCVFPTIPVAFGRDSFRILALNGDRVILSKTSNSHEVFIPAAKIVSVYPAGEGSLHRIEIEGRLQWLDRTQRWRFFPEVPPEGDTLGVGRTVDPRDPVIVKLISEFESRGERVGFGHETKAARSDYAVVYDDDGRYLRFPDRPHDQILLRRVG